MDCDICGCTFPAHPDASTELHAWSEGCCECAAPGPVEEEPLSPEEKLELGENLRLSPEEVEQLLRDGKLSYFRLVCPQCQDRMLTVTVDDN